METPPELAFSQLLLIGVGLMLLAGASLLLFIISYQKRLLEQQLRLRAAESSHQSQLLLAVIGAQETERERIGRDLHDDVGSTVAMAHMLVERLAQTPPPEEARSLLGLAHEVLETAVREVRNVSHSLYPAVLARVGLAEAIDYLAEVSRRSSSLNVTVNTAYPQALALPQELALYRICQELVHNVLKHAHGAAHLHIELRQSDACLTLTVADDGCGFPALAATDGSLPHAGVGLRSIGVRVDMLGARLVQHSAPGQGTRTRIELDNPVVDQRLE